MKILIKETYWERKKDMYVKKTQQGANLSGRIMAYQSVASEINDLT